MKSKSSVKFLFEKEVESLLRKSDSERGSITIEAAMLIPILLTFFLFLMALVKISIAEIALDEAVSDTAQTVAHYSYLSLVAESAIQQETDGFVGSLENKAASTLNNNEIAKNLLSKASEKAKEMIPTTGQLLNDHVAEGVYSDVVKEKYRNKVGSSNFFNADGISIKSHKFPNNRNDAEVLVEAQTEIQIILPFVEETVVIRKKAVERAWAGS